MPFDRGRGLDPVRFERVRHSQEFSCSRFGMELDVFDFVTIFLEDVQSRILKIIRFRSKVDDSNFVMF